jgi:hypothetical protein
MSSELPAGRSRLGRASADAQARQAARSPRLNGGAMAGRGGRQARRRRTNLLSRQVAVQVQQHAVEAELIAVQATEQDR